MVYLAIYLKLEACGQRVLPDNSISNGQKLAKMPKLKTLKCDILGNFQTICDIAVFEND